MLHPTTLGACRDDKRHLLKQHDKEECTYLILYVIKGDKKGVTLQQKINCSTRPIHHHAHYFLTCFLNIMCRFHFSLHRSLLYTYQQFSSGYNELFFT